MKTDFQVILYYKYIQISDPIRFVSEHKDWCQRLNLKGRVLVATEGINGTLEGKISDIARYCEILLAMPGFADINIKKSPGTGTAFPKLKVKVRSEIVTSSLGEQDIDPTKLTGKYLLSEELHEWFEQGKKFYIVDMRNDYEQAAGLFQNSVLPGMGHFRDLSSTVGNLIHLKGETVVTVCTGGVRCEKASGFLVRNNFADVYQLKDGIVTYMEKYPNQHFKGKLYVFDQRILMGFNTDSLEHEVQGRCDKCGASSENYVNCFYDECHRHYICCVDCLTDGVSFCKETCRESTTAIGK